MLEEEMGRSLALLYMSKWGTISLSCISTTISRNGCNVKTAATQNVIIRRGIYSNRKDITLIHFRSIRYQILHFILIGTAHTYSLVPHWRVDFRTARPAS